MGTISETWLDDTISDTEARIPSYTEIENGMEGVMFGPILMDQSSIQ